MTVWKPVLRATAVALGVCLAASGGAQQPASAPSNVAAKHTKQPVAPDYQPGLDQHALDVIKAACDRLAAAKSMAFTAIVSYESPSRIGPPLIYSTKSEVIMQRPDKLRVITLGDGPRSEFYYDGKTMTAFAPAENLVAVTDAPPVERTVASAPPPEPEGPALNLLGLVIGGGEGYAVFISNTTHDIIRLKTGEGEGGWILRSVTDHQAVLERNNRAAVIRMPSATGDQK